MSRKTSLAPRFDSLEPAPAPAPRLGCIRISHERERVTIETVTVKIELLPDEDDGRCRCECRPSDQPECSPAETLLDSTTVTVGTRKRSGSTVRPRGSAFDRSSSAGIRSASAAWPAAS